MSLQALVLAILAPGGAAFLIAAVRSWLDLRNSAEGRERQAVASLDEQRQREARRAAAAEDWRDYWRRRAAQLEHLLTVAGVTVPAAETPPRQESTP